MGTTTITGGEEGHNSTRNIYVYIPIDLSLLAYVYISHVVPEVVENF